MKDWVTNNHKPEVMRKAKEARVNAVRDAQYAMFMKFMSDDIIPLETQLKRFKSTLR